MKNIHIIPTEKPSYFFISSETNEICRYFKKMDSKSNKVHIYITSDEKTLASKGDWYLGHPLYTSIHRWHTDVSKIDGKNVCVNKIILTTDQDLIADGVQSIDDTFLEWFVKNPSCESVEVKKRYSDFTVDPFVGYEIIIPQEEINFFQITVNAFEKSMNLNLEYIEEPKQETQGYICPHTKIQCDDECCVSAENCHIKESLSILSEPEQKYETERMYSEEDIMNALHSVELKNNKDYSKIYNSMKEFLNNLKK
jgi:hypothetical protein